LEFWCVLKEILTDFHIVYNVLGGVFVVFKNREFNMVDFFVVRTFAWGEGVEGVVLELCERRCEGGGRFGRMGECGVWVVGGVEGCVCVEGGWRVWGWRGGWWWEEWCGGWVEAGNGVDGVGEGWRGVRREMWEWVKFGRTRRTSFTDGPLKNVLKNVF
jgi:hypothetical protein